MRDRGIIYTGLLIFLALAALPVWRNLSAGVTPKGPQPVLPAHEKQCVAPVAFMKSSHMTLLLAWRESVVREGVRDYTSPDGRHFNMSLTNTCLHQCHTSKADFCDRCHNYEAVSPPCWDCHQDNRRPLADARGSVASLGSDRSRDREGASDAHASDRSRDREGALTLARPGGRQ